VNNSKLDQIRSGVGPLEADIIDAYSEGRLSRRGFLVKGSVVGLSIGMMGSILAACGDDEDTGGSSGGGGTIKQGGTIRIASQTPGGPLDPVAMAELGTYSVVVQAFEYLAGPGEGAAVAPMLAESWSPNADGSVWTFKLHSGVKWHDGSDFTSADVVASLDRLAGSNLKAYIVEGASKAVDPLTVEVTLNSPDGQFPYQVSIYNPQSVMTPESFVLGSTLDQAKNGTGAFKLVSFDPAVGASFERNDAWWGGKPNLDKAEFVFSEDLPTQVTGMAAGEVDAIIQFSVVGGDVLLNSPDLTVEAIRGAAHRQLWMNVREGTFVDPKVREAVALGIDRKALVDSVLKGKGDVGNDHPIAPAYENFDSSVPQRERDVEKAKALLKEAGKEGLKITMHVPDLQEIPQLAELMQTQLKDIGMDITLNVEPTSTFYDRWCKVYDSTNEPAGCDGGEEFGIVDYGNRGTPDVYLVKAYATGEWNSAHYNSPEFNAAVAAYQAALDTPARRAAIKDIETIANKDIPYVIPYFYNSLTAYKKNVSGIRATGLGHYYLGTAGFTE
jgi:peptide/nickel transport system substrate-binding protein